VNRFIKKRFAIAQKNATIWRKEHLFASLIDFIPGSRPVTLHDLARNVRLRQKTRFVHALRVNGRRRDWANSTGAWRRSQLPRTMATACKHPKVRIVSRHEDTEFVECLECGEVFDAEEFRDMEIEETAGVEDDGDNS
jgi:hypothetical protein